MLAPVLARLSGIPGVAAARVECSGTCFLLAGREPGALERAMPAVLDVLGPRTRRLEGEAREVQLARFGAGELWFSKDDIRGLSYVEARILATRMTDVVTAAVDVDAATAARVHDALLQEIVAALDHAHDTGGRSSSAWFWVEWPHIVERVSARLEMTMGAPERRAAAAALRAQP